MIISKFIIKLLEFCDDLNRSERDANVKSEITKKIFSGYYDCIFENDGSIKNGYYVRKDDDGVWKLYKEKTVKEDI